MVYRRVPIVSERRHSSVERVKLTDLAITLTLGWWTFLIWRVKAADRILG